MIERVLTGTRVRNRRLDLGLRQSHVAKEIGISGSYLNLIEHNRRRIGATLLGDLARVLEIDAGLLEDGTAASVLGPVSEAAASFPDISVEDARAEGFKIIPLCPYVNAQRRKHPEWADLFNV